MRAKILFLDGQPDGVGDIFLAEGLEVPESLPVTLDYSGPEIGRAKLVKEAQAVVAEISFSDPEILERVASRTPAIGGEMRSWENRKEGGSLIKEAVLKGLTLSTDKNIDLRIKTIGEQIAEANGYPTQLMCRPPEGETP